MGARWAPIILGLAAIVGLTVGAVIFLTGGQPPPTSVDPSAVPDPTRSASAEASTSAPATPVTVEPVEPVSYVGPSYDPNVVTAPTATATQSKLWFHDGSWWGVLVSERTNQLHVHELRWESQHWIDTGVVVDDRAFAATDVVAAGDRLWVVGAGDRNSFQNAVRLSGFTYSADAGRYVLDPDFPRTLTAAGTGAPTIASGPDGTLWLAYVDTRQLVVRSSTDGGVTWSDPVDPRSGAAASQPVEAVALASGPNGVTVAWTVLNGDELGVARTEAAGAAGDWQLDSIEVDGLQYGDDELSLRVTADDEVVMVVRTSLDRVENRNLDAAQLMLVQTHGEEWRQTVVARVRDRHREAQLVVDDARGQVHVFAEAEGAIYVKSASLAQPSFVTGLGTLVMEPPVDPGSTPPPEPSASAAPVPLPQLAGVTTTRQGVGDLGEIVVVAADDVSGRYEHAVIGLPGGRSAPTVDGHLSPVPDGVQVGLPPGATTYLFRDGFTAFEPGSAILTGWRTRSDPEEQLVQVGEPTPGDPSLSIRPDGAGDGPRACKAFPAVATGRIVVRATAQLQGGPPDSDATIIALRSNGQEVVTVRFGERGEFRFFAGDTRNDSAVPYQVGVWYRSTVVLDLGSQTYDWTVTPLDSSAVILGVENLPLRVPATSVGEVCAQVADVVVGGSVALLVDDVSVEVGPSE